jgi:hypothetical protein
MRSTCVFTIAAILAVLATESNAGPGSSSSSGSRASPSASTRETTLGGTGVGSRTSSTAPRRGAASTGLGVGNRSAARPSAVRPYGQQGVRSSVPSRRSLLSAGTPPSPRLTQIIRERERSGPGWIGAAVLIALMSQHDLSASDRSWIQGKIDALDAEGDGDTAEALLPAVQQPMSISGASQPLIIGQSAAISVTSSGKAVDSVACDIEGADTQPVVSSRDRTTSVIWTPEHAGAYILNCRAGDRAERRILRVTSNN